MDAARRDHPTAADARDAAGSHAHTTDRGTRYRIARRTTTPWIVSAVLGEDADLCADCAEDVGGHRDS